MVFSQALPCLGLYESVGSKFQMFVATALRVGIGTAILSQEESNDVTDKSFFFLLKIIIAVQSYGRFHRDNIMVSAFTHVIIIKSSPPPHCNHCLSA